MYSRILVGLLAIVAVVLLLRWFVRTPPATIKRYLLSAAIALLIGSLILLAATGRLHWLVALGAAVLPLLRRLVPLLRYIPLLRGLATHFKSTRGPRATAGRQSQVNSRFLRMTLDHDTGTLDGEVLSGTHAGTRLGELSLAQLQALLKQYRHDDTDSARLLESYLERVHGTQWRTGFTQEESQGSSESAFGGAMTREEACRILGLDADADREAIIAAHRRLMQKLHPDRGGSDYLAAKINQAKDCLLGKEQGGTA